MSHHAHSNNRLRGDQYLDALTSSVNLDCLMDFLDFELMCEQNVRAYLFPIHSFDRGSESEVRCKGPKDSFLVPHQVMGLQVDLRFFRASAKKHSSSTETNHLNRLLHCKGVSYNFNCYVDTTLCLCFDRFHNVSSSGIDNACLLYTSDAADE